MGSTQPIVTMWGLPTNLEGTAPYDAPPPGTTALVGVDVTAPPGTEIVWSPETKKWTPPVTVAPERQRNRLGRFQKTTLRP